MKEEIEKELTLTEQIKALDLMDTISAKVEVLYLGYTRRDGKTPIFKHLTEVADAVPDILENIAYCHDIKEDLMLTDYDLKLLGLTEQEIITVNLLTHEKNQSYREYITDICKERNAVLVKIADMESNLSDAPSEHARNKYSTALPILYKSAASHSFLENIRTVLLEMRIDFESARNGITVYKVMGRNMYINFVDKASEIKFTQVMTFDAFIKYIEVNTITKSESNNVTGALAETYTVTLKKKGSA